MYAIPEFLSEIGGIESATDRSTIRPKSRERHALEGAPRHAG